MQGKVLSSVGAQQIDTSGNHASNLEYIDFICDDPDSNMETVFSSFLAFRFPIQLSISWNRFSDSRILFPRNPILVHNEEGKENLTKIKERFPATKWASQVAEK